MGLSVGIAGAIIMIAFLVAFTMIPNTMLKLTTSLSGTMSDEFNVEDSISKTSIKITSVTAQQNQDDVDFTVLNYDLEKLWDYENFDVIISYDQANPVAFTTEKLTYDGFCGAGQLTRGTWCIDQLVNDVLDPQILNTDESIDIKSRLNKKIDSSSPDRVKVVITVENGVTDEYLLIL